LFEGYDLYPSGGNRAGRGFRAIVERVTLGYD